MLVWPTVEFVAERGAWECARIWPVWLVAAGAEVADHMAMLCVEGGYHRGRVCEEVDIVDGNCERGVAQRGVKNDLPGCSWCGLPSGGVGFDRVRGGVGRYRGRRRDWCGGAVPAGKTDAQTNTEGDGENGDGDDGAEENAQKTASPPWLV